MRHLLFALLAAAFFACIAVNCCAADYKDSSTATQTAPLAFSAGMQRIESEPQYKPGGYKSDAPNPDDVRARMNPKVQQQAVQPAAEGSDAADVQESNQQRDGSASRGSLTGGSGAGGRGTAPRLNPEDSSIP